MSAVSDTHSPAEAERTPREVFIALSGLIVTMFVAVLSGTVVSTSMPRIIADLGGDQSAYTWVITASLLATAVSTPIWGKLADLVNRKVLLQLSIGLFVVGTAIAGFAQDTTTLIAVRVVQGLGAGGLMSLVMIIVALIISPRERGKYMGFVGGIMAVATIGGPLLGGVITDAWGWRANFFLPLPLAIVALLLLQFTLHLPKLPKRPVKIDFVGAILMAVGVSLALVWVTLGDKEFAWDSKTSLVMIGVAAAALIAFVIVEFFVAEPIVPMKLFKNRTFTLAVIASIAIGVAMFATSVFLAQYFQLARGATPTESGLMTIPMIVGQMGASIIVGALISRFGKWKGFMVAGALLVIAGTFLMTTLRYDTDYLVVSVAMVVLGAGLGMVMQNLTLVVQNDTPVSQLGAASSNVNFFRSIAGTVGVTVMGSLLATQVSTHIADGFEGFVPSSPEEIEALKGLQSGALPNVHELPDAIRVVIEGAYGQGISEVFWIAVPLAVLSLIAIAFLPNRKLSTKSAAQELAEELAEDAENAAVELAEAEIGAPVASVAEQFDETDASREPVGAVTGSMGAVDGRGTSEARR
ncbi:MDR family MFS transporter [Agromyces larvae]|uniref:MFS transporter n=1 Tax=Agromyces larvae TaxID=2929802 RepID=A0ABY4BXT7_9MICO|nr:MDR family MFS transporter [Agromyces larvae]UOE43983.1 MFS transporter [Agromyces larvae]